jgi:hypothetical protein
MKPQSTHSQARALGRALAIAFSLAASPAFADTGDRQRGA